MSFGLTQYDVEELIAYCGAPGRAQNPRHCVFTDAPGDATYRSNS